MENTQSRETNANKETTEAKERVEFSEPQQEKIEKIINKRFGTLKGEAETLKAEGETLRADNESLRSELSALKEADENKGSSAKELASNLEAVAKERLDLKILSVLVTYNVVDQEAAATLLAGKIYLDKDGQAVGLDEDTGETSLDNSGKPASLDFYIRRFLTNRPYLVRSPPTMGSGVIPDKSQNLRLGGLYSDRMRRKDFDLLPHDEKLKFVRKHGEVIK